MVLKLYGNPYSTCTARVAIVLYEKKIPFELVAVDLRKGEHKTPEFLAKQPFGQVPYIDDDGFTLYESRAIARYLTAKYATQGPKLVPDSNDLKAVALHEQALSVETANFNEHASGAVAEGLFKKMLTGQPADPEVFNKFITKLEATLKVYEVILGKQKYIAGDELTLADIFHLPYGHKLAQSGSDIMSRQGKNVTRWWNDISARESWKTVEKGVPSRLE